jgi:hypothetical protein
LESWKIIALIGTIVFLISGFLPLVSLTLFDFSFYFSLIHAYNLIIQGGASSSGEIAVTAGAIGILLTVILYPLTVVLGFAAIAKQKIAIVAGILGLLCWIGWLAALNELGIIQYAGLGVYVGFIGSIILLAAFFIKPKEMAAMAQPPPPPTS